MASRDIEIELMANMQELLAQQKVALKMMGRILELHESLLKLRSQDLEEENERGRSRSPVRPSPTPAEIDRQRYQQRRRCVMSETSAWEEARQEDPADPIEDPMEMATIPGNMACEVFPEQDQAADTVEPTLIRQ